MMKIEFDIPRTVNLKTGFIVQDVIENPGKGNFLLLMSRRVSIRFIVCFIFTFGAIKFSQGQTVAILLDFIGNPFTCGGDNTYANGSGSVTFNGGLPASATITNIGVSANLGKSGGSNANFSFSLNSTAIGSINGVSALCQSGSFNAGTIPAYNNTGNNSLSFTGSGGSINGLYNVTLTITYACTVSAPGIITPVTYCQNAAAAPLTASGSNLLWYTVATGGTGTSTAPTPVTTSGGSSAYFVSQTIGCEGARAQINVVVNPLPVSSVTNQTNITCNAANDGTIALSASGGTGPYFFSVDNGVSFLPSPGPGVTSYTFTNLIPNNPYRIKVKDANSCISK